MAITLSAAAPILQRQDRIGQRKPRLDVSAIAVEGDSTRDIRAIEHMAFVTKGRVVCKQP